MSKTEEKEVKVEKMVLNIEGEKVTLSMDQAKKLKKVLEELFGKEVVKETEHHYHRDYWYRPWYWNTMYTSNPNFSNYDSQFKGSVLCSAENKSLEVTI